MIKLIKEKEVIKEEVEIPFGIYYFNDDGVDCKIELLDDGDDFVEHRLTRLEDFNNFYGVRVFEKASLYGEDIPYSFKKFIFGGRKNEITEQEFEQQKQEVIKRLL
jgi:hypothetical protein